MNLTASMVLDAIIISCRHLSRGREVAALQIFFYKNICKVRTEDLCLFNLNGRDLCPGDYRNIADRIICEDIDC